MRVAVISVITGTLGTISKSLERRLEGLEVGGVYPDFCVVDNGLNTEKSPGDLRRLAVTHADVKNSQGVEESGILSYASNSITIVLRQEKLMN